MECPSCNRDNVDAAKFCIGCGINFEEILKCAGCGAELAHDDTFCSACGKPIEPPTELLPEESVQPKKEKPDSSTPKSLGAARVLVITIISIVGLFIFIAIMMELSDGGNSSKRTLTPTQAKETATIRRTLNAQNAEATARALATKSHSVSHSYFKMSINKKNEFTIWINSIHNRSSRPSDGEWAEQLNVLHDAITSAKRVSPEYMNSAHFEFEFNWNTFFIPSLETSYGYYWKAFDDPSSIEAMNEAGTLFTAHRLNDEWGRWYESNFDTIRSNLNE